MKTPLVLRAAGLPLTVLLIVLASSTAAARQDSLRTDRKAIERVYYNHRLGQKPPFEQVLPAAALENLVQLDLRKEAALKQVYHVEITPAMLNAEVQRIDTTTRAPDVLGEIKAALANDPARFASSFAKPILVERLLREKFDNDDTLHSSQRRQAEQTRNTLLAAKQKGAGFDKLLALLRQGQPGLVTEMSWQLGTQANEAATLAADEAEIRKRFGPNAQILSSPREGGKDQKFYFDDLPGELQNVLQVQLRKPGDVSAVIETPTVFLLYVMKERTDTMLIVAGLSLPKRSYEQWLGEQGKKRS